MTKDDMEIVSEVQRAFAGKVGQERYEVWFGRGVRWERSGSSLRIAVADPFRLEYLRRAFRAELLAALASVAADRLQLEFVVDPAAAAVVPRIDAEGAAPPHAATGPAVAAGLSAGGGAAGEEAAHRTAQRLVARALAAGEGDCVTHKPPRRQFARLADFLASEPNRLALTAAQTAASRPGTYSPLLFVGPPGSGKTHLLEGIWRGARESRSVGRVIYLTAEQFTNQFLDALRHTGTPNFRRKYRDVELLLIDDVQFFGGKQSTIVELVHTIDTLQREGRQLVFAADRPPTEMRPLGPELVTRLGGGLVCTLQPADYATRLGILNQLALRHAFTPPPDVLSWMAGQFNGDARQLAGALNRLRAMSEAHERAVDLDFAQAALDDLVHASRRPVRLPDILEAVCGVFGVEAGEVQSSSKSAAVTAPRMLVMFLARKWTRSALSEISKTLGRKSHSTVVSAQHKVSEWLAEGRSVPLGHGECKVEDAIKRVEAQLKLA